MGEQKKMTVDEFLGGITREGKLKLNADLEKLDLVSADYLGFCLVYYLKRNGLLEISKNNEGKLLLLHGSKVLIDTKLSELPDYYGYRRK